MAWGLAQPQEVSTTHQNITFHDETHWEKEVVKPQWHDPQLHDPLVSCFETLTLAFDVIGVISQTVSQQVSERNEAEILRTQRIWVAVFL